MIDHSKLSMRGRYGIATGGAVTDHVLMAVATEFENQVMRKIQALSPTELAQRFSGNDPLLATHKYDGEGALVYFAQGEPAFAFSAPGGRVRLGFPALDELSQRLEAAGCKRALLRCELYLDSAGSADGARRSGVSEVIRVSFSGTEADLARLRLAVLDIVMLDGKDLRHQQADFARTLELLRQLVGDDADARAHVVQAEAVPEREVAALFARSVAAGGEGLVLRRLNRAEAFKVKPQRSVDALIVGFVEGEFEGQYGVTSLLTALVYPGAEQDPRMQTFVRVGSGLTDAERVALLDRLRPLLVAAPLPMTDSSGRALQFVRPELIAEVHGEDLIAAEGGREQRSQLLAWDSASGAYRFLGLTPCPRLSFARFQCLREDKQWRNGGARIEQILERAEVPTPVTENSETRVLRREVYAKGEMLRKLVVVHKAGDLPFPYLIYWTDYSARRAEPLKVSTEVASNETRAMALAEQLLAENLTKGFNRVGG
jgi:hypothetical protein